jgi:hypothetical protein
VYQVVSAPALEARDLVHDYAGEAQARAPAGLEEDAVSDLSIECAMSQI